jgi:hypothetical protein
VGIDQGAVWVVCFGGGGGGGGVHVYNALQVGQRFMSQAGAVVCICINMQQWLLSINLKRALVYYTLA